MAKQVKLLSGSSSAAMYQQQIPVYDNYGNIAYYNYQWAPQQTVTIYTVPAGRIAKVELHWFSWNLPTTGATLTLGNTTHFNLNIAYAQYNLRYWQQEVTAQASTNYYPPYYMQWPNGVGPRYLYLNAGESIRFTSPSQGYNGTSTFAYNFLVVEEY